MGAEIIFWWVFCPLGALAVLLPMELGGRLIAGVGLEPPEPSEPANRLLHRWALGDSLHGEHLMEFVDMIITCVQWGAAAWFAMIILQLAGVVITALMGD